ncbi:MAG TPA: TonB-dependent receptor [Luteimonas sp.]|nr:TonB-dependent receptor [Luteimonas sp.]
MTMRREHHHALLYACLLAAGACLPAAAQPAGDSRSRTVYAADYFDDVAPANAYDMVLRLPGFTIVESDADVRGYAGATGNVLFDGARPTSKREDTAALLKRIPARAVARIELIHAGMPGIDMGGYAVLANVVRRDDASTEWAVETGFSAATDGGAPEPRAKFEYGRRRGDTALDVSLKSVREIDDDTSHGSIRTREDADTRRRSLDMRTIEGEQEAAVSWRQPLASGRLSLTGALRGEDARTTTRIGASAVDDAERIGERERYREAEVGMRFVRQFQGRTTLEAMASVQRGWLEEREHSQAGDDDERFEGDTGSGETIARIALTHARSDVLSFNAALEGAYNALDGDSRVQEGGVDVPLPGSDVRIRERRGEAALGATWNPAQDWTIEPGLRVERSEIAQSGDSPLQRGFTYAKPRLALRWDAGESDQWRLSLSREVGQLDFNDFVASASLDGGVVSAGNAELEPDKTWRATLSWEHRFGEDAALTLGWTHDRIEDVVDRVLVVTDDDVFDAPGNIGRGRRDTLSLDLAAPLDAWGIVGGRIRSTVLWRNSRVTDPVTGLGRGISEEKPVEGEIEFSQELPALRANWGVLVEHIGERKTKYRYDRITRESEAVGWTLFAERRIGEHWRLRAEATDLFGRSFSERREKYDGTRADGAVGEVETRRRRTPGVVSLTIRRSVGG